MVIGLFAFYEKNDDEIKKLSKIVIFNNKYQI
jgi:hypothetical protein